MKILICSHYFASHKGGIEIVAQEQYRSFSARGHEVVWIAADASPAPSPIGKSRAIPLPAWNFIERKTGLPLPIPRASALKTIYRELRSADILILHDCLYIANIFAFLLARVRGVPIIINQHVSQVTYRNPTLRLAMRIANALMTRPMLSHAEKVVFESDVPRRFFGTVQFKNPPETVFNGVDTGLFRPLGGLETTAHVRHKYGLAENGAVVLFVGRFVEKKGLSVLKRMAAERPNYTWAFAGWGPLDPRNWNMPNVRIFSELRGESMAALYCACDLFVLPSSGEGFPLVIQEALATGLPVVCGAETLTADPELPSFVRGVPVSSDDERTCQEFLSVIDDALGSRDDNGESERRRSFAVSRYSWARTADRYLEIASDLLAQRSSLNPRAIEEVA